MTMSNVIVRLKNVSKSYANGADRVIPAVNAVSLEFYANEWTYVVGGNGSGKTTLLKLLSGDLLPDAGEVLYGDTARQSLVFIEQGTAPNLVPSMTVYENLLLARADSRHLSKLRWYRRKALHEQFAHVLSPLGLGLDARLNAQVGTLSGGQQQAIVAAEVLLTQPKLVLLDEFTTALDKKVAPIILRALEEHVRKSDAAIVAVTHDYHVIESNADRVIILDNGRVTHDLRKAESQLTANVIMEKVYGQ